MTSKLKEISRRTFLTKSTKNTTGIFATTAFVSCTSSEELSTDKKPAIDNNEKTQKVTCYEVDPAWPQKPDEFTWGAVPGVFVDSQERVWMITRSIPAVQVYDADGTFLMAWGTISDKADSGNNPGDLTFTSTPNIHFLRIDHEGNVWFAERDRHVVRKCTPDGKLLLTLGTLNEPGEDETHFDAPTDMAITPAGDVFVSDGNDINNRIVHFDSNGRFIKAWGSKGTGPGEFNCPHALAIDSKGLIYVADRGNTRVQVFDQSGTFLDQWPNIIVPFDLWISDEDDIWVCGFGPLRTNESKSQSKPRTEDQLVLKFNTQGKLLQLWTLPRGHNPGELDEVHGMALDSKGNIYMGDGRGMQVKKFVRQ